MTHHDYYLGLWELEKQIDKFIEKKDFVLTRDNGRWTFEEGDISYKGTSLQDAVQGHEKRATIAYQAHFLNNLPER